MRKSLEKRLNFALKKKEEAEKEKLSKEEALEHEQRLMQKIVEESKRLEQEEKEILKVSYLMKQLRNTFNISGCLRLCF